MREAILAGYRKAGTLQVWDPVFQQAAMEQHDRLFPPEVVPGHTGITALEGCDEEPTRNPEDDPSFSPDLLLQQLVAHDPLGKAREEDEDLSPLPIMDNCAAGEERFLTPELFADTPPADLEAYVILKAADIITRYGKRVEDGYVSDASSVGVEQDELDRYPSDHEDDGVIYDEEELE